MPEGYVKGVPDAQWWLDQIRAGIEFRKKIAKEPEWNRWRRFYRGEFDRDVLPKNIFFMMMRTVVPRIYFRNPSISVVAKTPGPLALVKAQVLERIDNKLIRTMKVKRQIKRMVQNAFMFGTAFGKLGYGAEFTPTPEDGDTEAPTNKHGAVEYRAGILPNMPWFMSAHPGHIVVPTETADFESSRWVAHFVRRPLDDVREDTRLKNVAQLTAAIGRSYSDSAIQGLRQPLSMVDMYEIRDKKTKRVIVLAPFLEKKILFDGEDDMQGDHGPAIYPLVFNDDDEWMWGVPDSVILEPFQLEINEIKTQMMKHRRASIVKILAQRGTMTDDEKEKLTSEDVLAVFEASDINAVKPMQTAEIPQSLLLAGQDVMQDIRETVGFGRNQFGDYAQGSADRTKFEAQIVNIASEIRVDERRDMIADLIVDLFSDVHRVITQNWRTKEVVDIIGPAGVPIWLEFTGGELSNIRYDVAVDPDSSLPETKALREQKAVQVYGILRTNPLIDPVRLTSYLLHEMHGVQFDDMLRGLPPGTMQDPMSIGQYSQMIAAIGAKLGPLAAAQAQGGRPNAPV